MGEGEAGHAVNHMGKQRRRQRFGTRAESVWFQESPDGLQEEIRNVALMDWGLPETRI